MKKLILVLLMSVFAVTLPAVTAVLSTSPARPVAGEVFMLEITVDSTEQFSLQLPETSGIKISRNFSSNSMRQNIINGKMSVQAVYGLQALAETPGKKIIPPFTLDFNGKKVKTNSLELIIRDPATLPAQEKLNAVMTIEPERKLYPGKTVRVNLELTVPFQWNLRGISNITVNDLADAVPITIGNREGVFTQSSRLIRRSSGYYLELTGLFQLQKSGTFDPSCQITMQLNKAGEDDFFFSPPPQKRVVTAKFAKKLTVTPLPDLPGGMINTGLTGSWKVDGKLSKKTLRTGDIAEITLDFNGSMPTLNFNAPELTIPDARIYPPEVKKADNLRRFTVKYPFVALKPGDFRITLALAVFDPEKGVYEKQNVDLAYQVKLNPDLPSAPVPSLPATPELAQTPAVKAELVPFPVQVPGKTVKLPLIRNIGKWLIIPAILLAALIITILVSRKKRSPEANRNRQELKKLIREIQNSGDPGKILKESGAAVIARSLSLPSGATFNDIADAVENDDRLLGQFFRQLETEMFAPAKETFSGNAALCDRITAFLKKLLIFIIFFAGISLSAAPFDEGKAAFDKGDYRQSAVKFSEALNKSGADPALFYDLGSCYYMLGNYAKAYLLFSRSALLEPANSSFHEAVKKSAAKLSTLPPESNFLLEKAGICRPDQWIGIALILVTIAFWIIYLRKKVPAGIIMAVIMLILALTTTALAISQAATTYSPARAMVVTPKAVLRSIPASSGGTSAAIPAGTEVFIKESNGNYFRVENPDTSGWIEKSEIERFLPGNVW